MRVFVAIKQIPTVESFLVAPSGRARGEGVPLEMSAYCRRAVAKGVEIARLTEGSCLVASLGPPVAEEVLREALAWGADDAVLLSDPVFAGSDTLVTARALAALVELEGPFDLILVGRSSLDAETGQVGPELAEHLDLPFAAAVRNLELLADDGRARVRCEQDDGWRVSVLRLPAVLAVAERLCAPAKVAPAVWRELPADRVRRRSADDLGVPGPWGSAGSPTQVGTVRSIESSRTKLRCVGSTAQQVEMAVGELIARDALSRPEPKAPTAMASFVTLPGAPMIAVLLEPDRTTMARELLGCAVELAASAGARVVAVAAGVIDPAEMWSFGADELVTVTRADNEEDFAGTVSTWANRACPIVVIAPATYWGREVASRMAARLGAGLTGDAVELEMDGHRLVAWKPAAGGVQVAAITASSPTQMATVRPGALRAPPPRTGGGVAIVTQLVARPRGRIEHEEIWRDDDLETLSRAPAVIGVGAAVPPEGYGEIKRLASLLGAEIAGTRKVTDAGWLPRSRQVGITGRSIAPRLYLAVGLQGKLNHLIGVRGAGTILAVNLDPAARVFDDCDIGISGDWREVVPALSAALEEMRVGGGAPARSTDTSAELRASSGVGGIDV
ncbi:MAG: FAD-binding protein [Acidimicrobiales bacterium]